MISNILVDSVFAVEQYGELSGSLWDEEAAALGPAATSRRCEFAAGRACARSALAALGVPAQPILRGVHREPLWPEGIVGSITHCKGYSAAAVAYRDDVASLGIDAEQNEPMPAGTLAVIAGAQEISLLQDLPCTNIHWDRLLFSAKESLYKAWFPLVKRWLGFEEVSVTIDPESGTFQFANRTEGSRGGEFGHFGAGGRFIVQQGYILTSVIARPESGRNNRE